MRRLKETFRRRSPAPSVTAAESSHASTSSGVLASVIKVLDVAKEAVDQLPIPGLKSMISNLYHTTVGGGESY